MNYRDVILHNCESNSSISWWPRYAYHYTDITNALEILDCGKLYSRANAQRLGLMHNDNASRQVIDMTQTAAISCVRFYFRPLTPTQYHNEGFKHIQLRYDDDENANVPVPVFFVFDLEKLLQMPGVVFSEKGQSGRGGAILQSGAEAFSRLDFKKIYDNGLITSENMPYRHAEILYPSVFAIDACPMSILCRNNMERISLLNLLRNRNPLNYRRYQNYIKVCRSNMFENNGLFISDCQYYDGTLSVSFSDFAAKKRHTARMKEHNGVESLKPVKFRLELDWYHSRGVVHHLSTDVSIDYEMCRVFTFTNIPKIEKAKSLRVRLYIENALMCFMEYPLDTSELIK